MAINKSSGAKSGRPRAGKVGAVLVLLVLTASGWGGSPTVMTSLAEVGQNWEYDSDGNDIDDALDALISVGDKGPWVVDIHYDRPTRTLDETVLSLQHGVKHMYRYNNWKQDIMAYVDVTNVDGIAGMLDVYGVELLPNITFDPVPEHSYGTNASAHAVRVREYPLVADGYDHNDAVFEDLNLTGAGIVIAIMDSGVDNTHAALDDMDDNPLTTGDHKVVQKAGENNSTLYGGMQALVNLTADYCVDADDHFHHGTAVAGIALGTSGAGGPSGMAPGARMVDIAVRQVNQSHLDLTGANSMALDFVLDYNSGNSCYGAPGNDTIDILSISLGMAKGDPNRAMPKRITDVVRSGITVVMSAGNDGPVTSTLKNVAEGAIIVANAYINLTVNRSDDVLYWKSSRGPRSIADGDGDANDERLPHITAPGHLVLAPLAYSATGYVVFSGTSSAAPHISGIAALMLEANGALRPEDAGSLAAMGDEGAVPIRDLLVQTAQPKNATDDPSLPPPLGPAELIEQTGMFNLTWNNAWGYGLVDAYEAAVAAQNY